MSRVLYYSSAGNSDRAAHYLAGVVEKGITRALCGEPRRVWRPIPETSYGVDHRMCPGCAAAEHRPCPVPRAPTLIAPRVPPADQPRGPVPFEQARFVTFVEQVAHRAGFLRSITHHRFGTTEDGRPIYGDRVGHNYAPRDATQRADQHAAHIGLLDARPAATTPADE